jgi:hypothetical protein
MKILQLTYVVTILAGAVAAAPLAAPNAVVKRQILPPFKEQFFEEPPTDKRSVSEAASVAKRQILPPFKEQFFEEPPADKRSDSY